MALYPSTDSRTLVDEKGVIHPTPETSIKLFI